MQCFFATVSVSDSLIYALSWTLLHSIWQGLILAVFAGTMMWWGRKKPAHLRYNLLSLFLLAFVVAIGVTMGMEWQAQLSQLQGKSVSIHYIKQDLGTLIAPQNGNIDQAKTWLAGNLQTWESFFNQYSVVIVALWILVLCLKSIKMGLDLWSAYRIRWYRTYEPSLLWRNRLETLAAQIKVKYSVKLLESALVPGPAALGFFKPLILLPAGMINNLPADQVEAILLHELAHIRRKDYLVNFIQCLLENSLFFNPGLIWVSHLIRQERENCCDDLAIRAMKNKTLYVNALVAFQEYKLHGARYALAFAGQKTPLLDRVKRIINHHNYKTLSIMEKISLLVTVLLISGFTFLSLYNTQAQTPQENRISKFSNINVSGSGTASNPQIMFLQSRDGKTLSVKRVEQKIEEMYVNGEKLSPDRYKEYDELIKEVDEQIQRDREQAERDRAQAKLDREQAVRDREQAEKDRAQAERDRVQAKLDREQALKDDAQARLDREQASRDRVQAEKDRAQADLDRVKAKLDREQAMRDDAQAKLDKEQAVRDREQSVRDRAQADRDREQAEKDRAQAKLDREQAERDREQAMRDREQAAKDRKQAEEDRKMLLSMIEDMVNDKLVKSKESLDNFRLTNEEFWVNGVKQSAETHARYKAKYIKSANYQINYGSKGGGNGIWFSKQN